ncbi:MAG: PEP/pyruvate-binding domain-containing protein, partial [bacterium]
RSILTLALLAGAAPAAGGEARCSGDCDDDKVVGIAELITVVNVALGRAQLVTCQNGDRNGDGMVSIDELVGAVGHALEGCQGDIEPPPFKTTLDHPADPYLAFSATPEGPSWAKFTIRVSQPDVVYFQNSGQIPFHQTFVAQALEPYIGWTPAEIDAVSLHADGQQLVFGAVLYSPTTPYEVAIQLVRQDAYRVDEVIRYFTAVRAAVRAAPSVPFFYFPTFEQQESANAQRDVLAGAGIALGSTARWLHGDVCYAFGWAHGRIVYIAGDDIADAYEEGRLGPQDILLTDGVPAEVPFVAGVLSLAPSTPSSHVAILSADWEIPFAFLSQADSIQAAQALVGREVILRATTLSPRFANGAVVDPGVCQIRMVDVTAGLDPALAARLHELKRAPDLAIRPFVRAGSYLADVDTATPDDVVSIGGKAANYGFLRRAIPLNSRPAVAFTFDLWNDYLDQPMEGGMTLRQRIATLLAPFPAYPPADFSALFAALDDVRDLIDDAADFTPAQRTVVLNALTRFDANLPIRFRSSTNVEDSDVFTGAGLYESESGCVADEVDDDDQGPSRCDATRAGERGVFRALRKVFQSFYNDNAFLERLRHRVDETTVGMAILVHHTFTDDTEQANGVATLRVTAPTTAFASIVSQPGAYSVTNPENDGIPEIVEVFAFGASVFPTLRQSAARLPLGATVLRLPDEYTALTRLLVEVGHAFAAFHGETQFDIEFEYKKIAGEGLEVKQVRRIPGLAAHATPPVLINAPISLCTFQGEAADVFANYRLKSRWQPQFVSGAIEPNGAAFYTTATHQYVFDGSVRELAGAPSTWTDAGHASFDPQLDGVLGFSESWSVGSGATRRGMTLHTLVPVDIGPRRIPILFPDDLGFTLDATLSAPAPFLNYDDTIGMRSEDSTRLQPCVDQQPLTPGHLLKTRNFAHDSVAVGTSFYWPPSGTGSEAGYTAPLDRWLETTISGISIQPVVLHGFFSQTYRPEHHNFAESFIFDPHLEGDVAPATLAEWDAKGIRALVERGGIAHWTPRALTTDGRLVDLDDLLP